MKETIEILRSHDIDFQELSLLTRKDSQASEIMTEASTETIFIMATKKLGEDWRGVCKEIRKLCILHELLDTSVEVADARGLKAARSFAVDTNERIYKSWPMMKKFIIGILESRSWVALKLLRRGRRKQTLS